VKLDGFDITDEQYPPAEWYGRNVTLDTLKPVPEESRVRYDVSLLVFIACFYFSLLLAVVY